MATKKQQPKNVIRFDGPSDFLHDPSTGMTLAIGESGEVPEADAKRLTQNPNIIVSVIKGETK